MFKQSSKRKPMATYNKGSKRYKEIQRTRCAKRWQQLKEGLLVTLFVLFLSIDWDRTLDALMGIG